MVPGAFWIAWLVLLSVFYCLLPEFKCMHWKIMIQHLVWMHYATVNSSDLAYHVVDCCMYSNYCQCTESVPCMETEALIIIISFSLARLCWRQREQRRSVSCQLCQAITTPTNQIIIFLACVSRASVGNTTYKNYHSDVIYYYVGILPIISSIIFKLVCTNDREG